MAESAPLIRPREAASASRRAQKLGPLVAMRVVGDILAVTAGALIGYAYRFHFSGVPIPGGAVPSFHDYALAIPVVVGLWLVV
ncbi:MAG: hypothetical protein ACYDEA_12505, partial [Candidatus Dormibacteria bacterium]